MTDTTTTVDRREAVRLQLLANAVPACPRRAASWPDFERRWIAEPWPAYGPALAAAIEAGQLAACGACGGAVVAPTPDGDGWALCGPCGDAQRRYPVAQPAPMPDDLVVASNDLQRAELIRAEYRERQREAMRLGRLTPGWLLAAAGAALGLDTEALARVVARPGNPDNELPVPVLALFRRVDGAAPARPVRAWSHLAAVANVDQGDGYRLRRDGRWRKAESQRDVLVAEVRVTRDNIEARRVVPPPNGARACWWCGAATAPRFRWEVEHGKTWCGGSDGACPPPPFSGDPTHGAPAGVTALLVAAGYKLPYGAESTASMAAHTRGRFRFFGEMPDAKPGRPWAYFGAELETAVLDGWLDRWATDRSTGATSDEDRFARDAARAASDALRAEAQRSAEAAAREAVDEAVSETGRQVVETIIENVREQVGEVVADHQRRGNAGQPAAKPTGPTVTPGPAWKRRHRAGRRYIEPR